MYKCVIIDDESYAIDGLRAYIESTPQLSLVAQYTDSLTALTRIKEEEAVDLVFMDVDMPKINGIELAKEIRYKTDKLIFTTAHSRYAYEAFEIDADAYLLKPYSLGKFMITINKIFPLDQMVKTVKEEDYFFVKNKEDHLKLVKIKYLEIIAIESKRNDVLIYMAGKKVLTYMSLTEMTKQLTGLPDFVKWHRSFIINQSKIESISGNQVKLTNGLEITVGDLYRNEFSAFIADKLIKAGRKY